MPKFLIAVIFISSFSLGQVNTWTKRDDLFAGYRNKGALVYVDHADHFHLSMGYANDSMTYSEVMYSRPLDKWINYLPNPALYGVWADSTGKTRGNGKMGSGVFGTPYFIFKVIPYSGTDYLRPNLHHYRQSGTFYQYTYNPDDKKIYFYLSNKTFTYDTQTRLWDTLSVASHPSAFKGGTTALVWGSICYDPVNQEILLFSGAGVDADSGHCGTWTYKPSTNTWTQLNLAVQPPPRALSPMVYDAVNQVIILFGGDHLDYLTSDTWIYDCTSKTWIKKNPALSPAPRAGHSLLFLPKSQKVVLLGGYVHVDARIGYTRRTPFEMWTYNAAADEWKLIKAFSSTDTVPPFAVPHAAIAAADTGDRIMALCDDFSGGWDTLVTYFLDCDPAQVDNAGTQTYGVSPGTISYRTEQFDPVWYTQDVPAVDTATAEAFFRTMPVDTWVKLDVPKEPYRGRDWGTTLYVPERDLILKFTGGHAAYCGNEVLYYSPHTNRWHISFYPSHPLDYYGDSGHGPGYFDFNNRPWVTHAYDHYDYDVNMHRMLLTRRRWTFVFNPDIMDWEEPVLNHPDIGGDYHRISMTSTAHGIFGWMQRSSSTYYFYLFNANTRQWDKLPVTGETIPVYYAEDGGAAYDSKRDRMLLISDDGRMWAFDFSSNVLSTINATGSAPGHPARELVYEPSLDILFVQGDYVYHCSENRWEHLSLSKDSDVGNNNSVSSGYMYDPGRGLIYDSESRCQIYALKLSNSYPTSIESGAKPGKLKMTLQPNPVSSAAAIQITGPLPSNDRTGVSQLKVFNIHGQMVKDFSGQVNNQKRIVKWNANELSTGIYFLKFKMGNKRLSVKTVIIK
jgi:hypothetical protein